MMCNRCACRSISGRWCRPWTTTSSTCGPSLTPTSGKSPTTRCAVICLKCLGCQFPVTCLQVTVAVSPSVQCVLSLRCRLAIT